MAGEPLSIRSDEYLRWTPSFVGNHTSGDSGSIFDFKKSENYFSTSLGILPKSLEFFTVKDNAPNFYERLVPLQIAFASHWWFKVALAFIFIPLLLKRFNVSLPLGIASTVFIFFSPPNTWWSYQPINILGLAAAASYFLFEYVAGNQKRTKRVNYLSLLLAVFFIFQLPFQYLPWSIPISGSLMALTIALLILKKENLEHPLKKISISLGVAIALIVLKFWVFRSSWEVLAHTTYPGQRRIEVDSAQVPLFSTGITSNLFFFAKYLKSSNPSEVSVAFLEMLFPMIFLLPVYIRFKEKILAKVLIVASLIFSILSFWIIGYFPEAVSSINPLVFVPQNRLAQILGVLAILGFAILITFAKETSFFKTLNGQIWIVISIFISLICIFREMNYINNFFELNNSRKTYLVTFSLLILAVLFISITHSSATYFGLVAVMVLFNIGLNPVQVGTSDLTNSKISREIRVIDDLEPGFWASNEVALDALLIANTKQTFTGQQFNGPDLENWKILDQNNSYIEAWNRGAAFVTVTWSDQVSPTIENPVNDVINIHINPCDKSLKALRLKWILSRTEIKSQCLIEKTKVTTNYDSYSIYELKSG